ncbi:penicillin-binding protein activator [Belnapia rosea]|uniref:Amino acid/amide ABC transporter substrate-binding protein, HAAT family n=1 Tax=Belnapia rosea TaxID=938405 RepID=A0A1G6VKN7_9PROT|nr:penicillin-binding protein activator [Belnapia rosea]SDD53465.1 amino acid/amide ABC transporter substrate-binding protein, HAAT family [Belnapia rosea]
MQVPLRRTPFRHLLRLVLLLPLAACIAQAPPAYTVPAYQTPAAALPEVARTRVGLLLPLSGANRPLGQAMLNAAQLALFDRADPGIEFLPRDTGSTAAGAAQAAQSALGEGARALAGPLTLAETGAVAAPARAAGAPVMAFTSDAAQAGNGVWVLGTTPAEQAERVAAAAAEAGARRFGLIAPDDAFGRRLAAALRTRLPALGLPAPLVVLQARLGDSASAARDLIAQAGPDGLDAVLLGLSGERAKAAAQVLATAQPAKPRLLGTVLWAQDPVVAQEPALADAWFPGPDPATRAAFDQRYQSAFGERPPRLAGVAYDAAALASRAARGGMAPIGEAMLGADGPVRLEPDGLAQHGLAIFSVDPSGEPRLVQPAPIPGAS